MDPDEVPKELRDLIQIEEMSFKFIWSSPYTVFVVVNTHIVEFATFLPHRPSSLDALVVRRCSSDVRTFKDFNVRRSVVSCALYWLKNNNRYYSNSDIDEEVLGSLPKNGPLDDQIPRLEDIGDEMCGEMRGEIDGEIDEVND
ncbi:hypothetical protein C1646_667463 [Rhizophagus diaphanus]|nr:hypothetical protein C1646_667463 [Rhizophagus diaphanus] [Rhizophagus sp. MUCL 43196]